MQGGGGTRIPGKRVHIFKDVGFALCYLSHLSQIFYESKIILCQRDQIISFQRIFNSGKGGANPLKSPWIHHCNALQISF